MPCLHGYGRLLPALIPGLLVILGISSCDRLGETSEQTQVEKTFQAWKEAMVNRQTDQAMAYIPRQADDYLKALNSALEPLVLNAKPSPSPGVDLLLRTALEKKVPADLRSHLTLAALVQRMLDRHFLNPSDIQQIDVKRISISGDRASAEIYYQGTLTALRLPFLKDGDVWKIDIMALLPYAEVLMRVDRAIKGETEARQVDQLVGKLPSL